MNKSLPVCAFKAEILEILTDDKLFPKSFPLDEELQLEKIEHSIHEIENLFQSLKDKKPVHDVIQVKIESLIFSNPFLAAAEKYKELYKKTFNSVPQKQAISKFINISEIPDISLFIDDLKSMSAEKSKTFKISLTNPTEKYIDKLYEIFQFNEGKIPNLEKILLWFPDYLLKFQENYQTLMYGNGPLPITFRFFIAIMAVSALGCDYLLNRLITHFIKNGGDVKWLEGGLANCPKKFHKLSEINFLLAFCPWKIKEAKFFHENSKGELYWSKNEIVEAIIILSFHHSISCICISNGLFQEEDFSFLNFNVKATEQKTCPILEKEKVVSSKESSESIVLNYLKNYVSDTEKEEKKLNLENVEKKMEQEKKKKTEEGEKNLDVSKMIASYDFFERFLMSTPGEKFILENFNWHIFKGLKSYDCSWQNNTYCFINEFFPDLAQVLDEKFKYIKNMTNRELEGENVNTDPFRRAIWNYSENVYGLVYSNYDYGQINKCIPRHYKAFIKKIITDPGSINSATFEAIPLKFQPFEYTQSSLLAVEAKFEISLMYSMQAIEELL